MSNYEPRVIELQPGEVIHLTSEKGKVYALVLCDSNGNLEFDNENVQETDTMLLTENGWMIDEVLPKNTEVVFRLIREERGKL